MKVYKRKPAMLNDLNLLCDYIDKLETKIKELEKKLTPEAMLKDLKRSKLYEKGGNI